MRRRALLAGIALAAAGDAFAQQGRAQQRVAILTPGSNEARPVFVAFREELRNLGYVEGRSIAIEFHLGQGSADRLRALAGAIAQARPDVVLADGGNAAIAMHEASRDIPIVTVGGIDPLQRVLVASFARPGGNVTGISTFSDELLAKQVELLSEIAPSARRIGAIGAQLETHRRALAEAAASRGLTLRQIGEGTESDVARALTPEVLAEVDALVVAQNPVLAAMSADIVARINASGRPAIYAEREYLDVGGLATYGIDFVAVFRRLAGYVDRILRGANPADMPIERPERLALAINLRTARALGLALPPAVIARADEVIE